MASGGLPWVVSTRNGFLFSIFQFHSILLHFGFLWGGYQYPVSGHYAQRHYAQGHYAQGHYAQSGHYAQM